MHCFSRNYLFYLFYWRGLQKILNFIIINVINYVNINQIYFFKLFSDLFSPFLDDKFVLADSQVLVTLGYPGIKLCLLLLNPNLQLIHISPTDKYKTTSFQKIYTGAEHSSQIQIVWSTCMIASGNFNLFICESVNYVEQSKF